MAGMSAEYLDGLLVGVVVVLQSIDEEGSNITMPYVRTSDRIIVCKIIVSSKLRFARIDSNLILILTGSFLILK